MSAPERCRVIDPDTAVECGQPRAVEIVPALPLPHRLVLCAEHQQALAAEYGQTAGGEDRP